MFDPDAYPLPDLGLSCPQCGYPLANLTRHVCPECGRAFTLDECVPEGEWPRLIAGGEEVRSSPDILALFKRYHVPYLELVDPVSAALSGIGGPSAERGRPVGVLRERYLETIDLIRRLRQNEPMPEPPDDSAQADVEWTCASCGETVPGTFDVCWQCGAERSAPPGPG